MSAVWVEHRGWFVAASWLVWLVATAWLVHRTRPAGPPAGESAPARPAWADPLALAGLAAALGVGGWRLAHERAGNQFIDADGVTQFLADPGASPWSGYGQDVGVPALCHDLLEGLAGQLGLGLLAVHVVHAAAWGTLVVAAHLALSRVVAPRAAAFVTACALVDPTVLRTMASPRPFPLAVAAVAVATVLAMAPRSPRRDAVVWSLLAAAAMDVPLAAAALGGFVAVRALSRGRAAWPWVVATLAWAAAFAPLLTGASVGHAERGGGFALAFLSAWPPLQAAGAFVVVPASLWVAWRRPELRALAGLAGVLSLAHLVAVSVGLLPDAPKHGVQGHLPGVVVLVVAADDVLRRVGARHVAWWHACLWAVAVSWVGAEGVEAGVVAPSPLVAARWSLVAGVAVVLGARAPTPWRVVAAGALVAVAVAGRARVLVLRGDLLDHRRGVRAAVWDVVEDLGAGVPCEVPGRQLRLDPRADLVDGGWWGIAVPTDRWRAVVRGRDVGRCVEKGATWVVDWRAASDEVPTACAVAATVEGRVGPAARVLRCAPP